MGKNFVTPRGLKASLINKYVQVQGIVTRMSLVKPKLEKSFHYIDQKKQGMIQKYKDQFCIEGQGDEVNRKVPVIDAEGNSMTMDYGYCEYKDCQKVVIQEMPENAPVGQLPRSVTVFVQKDLCD